MFNSDIDAEFWLKIPEEVLKGCYDGNIFQ